MLRALVSKELRLAVRSRRVWWAAAVMLALASIAGAAGTAEHLARVEEHRSLVAFAEKSFVGQRPDHPHSIAHNGYVVSRPPAPLGHLDAGVQTAYGRWLRLDAHQTRPLSGARTSEIARAPGAGRLDLGLLLAVFAPVVIVLLGFDQIARERARGLLAMLSAAGLEPRAFVLSKLAGLAARVTLAIGAPVLAAIVVCSIVAGDLDVPRLVLWLAAHGLALLVWMLVVLAASAAAPTPRGSLLAGVALWAALALFVPPMSGAVSRVVAPVAPPGELMVKAQVWAESAHAQTEDLRNQALRDIKRRHPEWDGTGEPPEVVDAVMLALADRDASKKMRDLFAELDAEQDRQERWAAALSFASPSGLASLSSSALAGSDLAHMRAVFLHYESYRRDLMDWFNQWWAKQGRGGFESYGDEKKFDAFDRAPRPAVPVFTLGFAAQRAGLALGLLAAIAAFAFVVFASLSKRALARAGGAR